MSFFRHTNAGGISVVIPPGNEPRDPRTGRLLKDLTAGQLAIVYERNPELRKLAIEPYDQRKLTQPELRGTWNGSPIVDVGKKARESALLRDPSPARKAPTKPVVATRRHASERAIAVAWHEAFHAGAALYYGLRVSSTTIIPDDGADGCTMVQDVKSVAPTLHGLVMLAGQEGDAIGGFRLSSENYATDDADIGGSLEWREALRQRVRSDLPKFIGGVNEIARQLLAKETLSEFQIKSAFIRGQRRTRGVGEKAAPAKGRVTRTFNLNDLKDLADWNRQMGRELDAAPIGYASGHIVDGSYKR
jgi:hypothetical protein